MANNIWSIGRADAKKCDILLNHSTVSSTHAKLSFENGKYFLVDNNSTNGTYILRNNQKIILNKKTEILPNDSIYIGQYKIDTMGLIELSINSSTDIPTKQPTKQPPKKKINKKEHSIKDDTKQAKSNTILYTFISLLIASSVVAYVMFFMFGKLSIQTNPRDASVYIDGEILKQKTPLSAYKLRVGKHHISLIKDGYIKIDDDINIKNKNQVKSYDFIPSKTEVTITSTPSKAIVFINEQKYGVTPYRFLANYNNVKKYKIQIKKSMFDTFEQTYTYLELQNQPNLNINLIRNQGLLKILSTPSGAKLKINNQIMGRTTFNLPNFKRDKRYKIELSKKRYKPLTKIIKYTQIEKVNVLEFEMDLLEKIGVKEYPERYFKIHPYNNSQNVLTQTREEIMRNLPQNIRDNVQGRGVRDDENAFLAWMAPHLRTEDIIKYNTVMTSDKVEHDYEVTVDFTLKLKQTREGNAFGFDMTPFMDIPSVAYITRKASATYVLKDNPDGTGKISVIKNINFGRVNTAESISMIGISVKFITKIDNIDFKITKVKRID